MGVRFDGRVAAITGAGKGLGRSYARWMAARGAAIVVNNRTHPGVASSAQRVVDEIVGAGGRAVADEHGVEHPEGARAMVETALSRFGRLDVLVCNAAISVVETPFVSTTAEQWRDVIQVNILGTVLPLRAAVPHMVEAGYGRIVITTSQIALFGRAGSTAYGATKLAVVGLARSLALELAPHGIRVNVVAPGAVTQLSSNLGPEWAERASPDRVAPVVGWLCSEQCDLSGTIVNTMGGKARRVRFLEGAITEIDPEDPGAAWPTLSDFSDPVEHRTAPDAGQALMPGPRRFSPSPE